MELQATRKHLIGSTLAGVSIVLLMVYNGSENPERYYYTGSYNTHDAQFVNANPDAHHKITYSTSCNECHVADESWSTVSNQTCMTSQCHTALDPVLGNRDGVKVKFDAVSKKYHDTVKSMSCNECHRIHEFREVESKWVGAGFDHALLIPNWSKNSDCMQCHEGFDQIESIETVAKTVPTLKRASDTEVRIAAHQWLSDRGKAREDRRKLGLNPDDVVVAAVPVFAPLDIEAMNAARAEGTNALLLFTTPESKESGGIVSFFLTELLPTRPVIDALEGLALYDVGSESHAQLFADYNVFRAGTLILLKPDGSTTSLQSYRTNRDVIQFLRQTEAK